MGVIFCHDHRFFVDDKGRIYSYGQFDRAILKRYVDVFGKVTIAARGVAISPTDDISRFSLCSSDDIDFLWLPNLSSLRGLTIDRPAARNKLANAISKADAVIARLPSEIGLLALSIARQQQKPNAAEVVACIWDGLSSHGSLVSKLYAPIAFLRMRHAVARTKHVLYVTQHFLQSRYPSYGIQTVVSNVEIPTPDRAILQNRLHHISNAQRHTVFGMIAALFHKEKGIDIAVEAFSMARKENPDISLRILGPGDPADWRDTVKRFGVEDCVEFCGSLPRGSAVLEWIDGIDVYVQASFQEGLPRALIEAMSRACPALASSAGGTAELVKSECLHRPGDIVTLSRQMIAATNTPWRETMAQANFEKSKTYASDILNTRRAAFWTSFANGDFPGTR